MDLGLIVSILPDSKLRIHKLYIEHSLSFGAATYFGGHPFLKMKWEQNGYQRVIFSMVLCLGLENRFI